MFFMKTDDPAPMKVTLGFLDTSCLVQLRSLGNIRIKLRIWCCSALIGTALALLKAA
jgi:hypothetical protein